MVVGYHHRKPPYLKDEGSTSENMQRKATGQNMAPQRLQFW